MKAVCWFGKHDMRVENVPDPKILNPRDCIVSVTRTAICGSDLHLYNGFIPTMEQGDIVGHEFMGEVVEVGPRSQEAESRRPRRRSLHHRLRQAVSSARQQLWSACDNTNPNAQLMEGFYGQSGSGLFGYSHMMGGYAGGQAQFVRVPFADVGPMKVPKATRRREGSVPLRHLPHRLHGGRELRHSARLRPSRFGAAARSASSPSAAPSCSAPNK